MTTNITYRFDATNRALNTADAVAPAGVESQKIDNNFYTISQKKLENNGWTSGDLLRANSSGVITALAKATDGQILRLVSGAPAWSNEYVWSLDGSNVYNNVSIELLKDGAVVDSVKAVGQSGSFTYWDESTQALNIESGFASTENQQFVATATDRTIFTKSTNTIVFQNLTTSEYNSLKLIVVNDRIRISGITSTGVTGLNRTYIVGSTSNNGSNSVTIIVNSSYSPLPYSLTSGTAGNTPTVYHTKKLIVGSKWSGDFETIAGNFIVGNGKSIYGYGLTTLNVGNGINVTGTANITGSTTIGGNLSVAGGLTVNGTVTAVNSTTVTVDDKNIELGAVDTKTGLVATLTAGQTTVTLTTGTTANLVAGMALTRTAGTGIFGTNARISTIVSSTQFTTSASHITSGSITFDASVGDYTADGGGLTLKGLTDKTIIWDRVNANWTSSEHWNIASTKEYKINNTSVLNNTTLGSNVVNSSLTKVGTIATGTWQATAVGSLYGGTGQSSWTKGDILYASANNVLSKLAKATDGQVLTLAGGLPAWGQTIKSPDSSTANTAVAGIQTGNVTAGNYNSGNAYLATGNGYGTGDSGTVYIQTGSGGNSANGNSGSIDLRTGTGKTASGSIHLNTGDAIASGGIDISPGVSSQGLSGDLYLSGGNNSYANANSTAGHTYIYGGSSSGTAGRGGDVYINGGNGVTADGKVYVGTFSAITGAVEIGNSLITTKINGNLQLPNIGSTNAIMKVGTNNQVGYLANGTNGQVLKIVDGSAAWAADTDTTYGVATSTVLGLVKLGHADQQAKAANSVSSIDGRSYAIQLNTSDQMVVNVPWTDTTYSAGTNISLSGTTINHGNVTRTNNTSTQTAAFAGTFTVIDSITTSDQGHITAVNTKTVTMPSNPNSDINQSIAASTSSTAHYISFVANTSGSQTGYTNTNIKVTPSTGTVTATNFDSTSDKRFKEDLQVITDALAKVNAISGYTFTFKETGQRSAGLITQEVEPHLPEVVGGTEDKQTLNYDGTIALLVEAIKELNDKVDALKQQINK